MSTIKGTGVNASVEAQVDPTRRAMRVTSNPIEAFGHYAIGVQTGAIAATVAAAADLFHIFWGDPLKNFLLKKLVVGATTGTVYTTLSGLPLEMILGHNATAVGSGGNAVTMNSSNRLRQTFPNSALAASGEIRYASTAALTAPTGYVAEANALANIAGAGFSLGTQPNQVLWDSATGTNDHPIILQRGDVLVVRAGPAGGGASGVAVLSFAMTWAEISNDQSSGLAY
jgi:hypothetical protein